ncbi:MAG: NAD(P)H-dependent oxidoreductase [Acidobacteriota bacterium]
MRILVVLAHPDPASFNHAVAGALSEGLREAGHGVDLLDLHAEGFRPEMTAGDLLAAGRGVAAPAVGALQARVGAASGLAFVFPIYWFGPPAMVKGFIDRVLFEGFAFRFLPGGRVEGLLRQERALLLCTAGASALLYRTFGFHRPMKRVLVDWTLKMCGVGTVKMEIFHGVGEVAERRLKGYLARARELGRTFFGSSA